MRFGLPGKSRRLFTQVGYRALVLTDSNAADDLARAGVRFVERVVGDVRHPALVGGTAASCRPEDGRFDARPEDVVDVDDPLFAAKVNAGWWRMAVQFELLDRERGFLLGVDYARGTSDLEFAWVRVRLSEAWDLAGSEVKLLGGWFPASAGDRFTPEIVAVSLDGRALLSTTLWGNGTVSTLAIRPR